MINKPIKEKMTAPMKILFCPRAFALRGNWGASAHCTHLQIAQATPQTKICKRVQFLPTL